MTNDLIRILIVDDSALYRQAIRNVLSEVPDVEVVGVAKDGVDALHKIDELQPDLLTLDVQMPGMDGIEVLRKIATKAIMVSSFTSEGAQVTTDALLEGAFDFILKPSGRELGDTRARLASAFQEKIAAFRETSRSRRERAQKPRSASTESFGFGTSDVVAVDAGCQAVLVGTSTGGPAALKVVLPKLPDSLPTPVVVVQHMPAEFTRSLAKRLNELSPLNVIEAEDGCPLEAGTVVLAPGGRQLRLAKRNDIVVTCVTDDPPENGCRPSADYLFRSATAALSGNVLAVVMTGMGRDGMRGARDVKNHGGCVFAQHEDGCIVYGMPKATIDAGLADRVLPLGRIGPAIVRHVKRSRQV